MEHPAVWLLLPLIEYILRLLEQVNREKPVVIMDLDEFIGYRGELLKLEAKLREWKDRETPKKIISNLLPENRIIKGKRTEDEKLVEKVLSDIKPMVGTGQQP